ncbi:MAG: hypothetical protein K2R98_14000 [Gemmataceae bacterium]|nr:hypothetical protein [Gemmataceae bacterium]
MENLNLGATSEPLTAPERRIELLEPPSSDGYFAVRIHVVTTTGRRTQTRCTDYLVRELPAAGVGRGCRGFDVAKLDAEMNCTGELPHVLLDPRDGCCQGCEECNHCKHADGLAALCNAGKPMPYRSAGDMAANDPIAFEQHMAAMEGFGGEPADEVYR